MGIRLVSVCGGDFFAPLEPGRKMESLPKSDSECGKREHADRRGINVTLDPISACLYLSRARFMGQRRIHGRQVVRQPTFYTTNTCTGSGKHRAVGGGGSSTLVAGTFVYVTLTANKPRTPGDTARRQRQGDDERRKKNRKNNRPKRKTAQRVKGDASWWCDIATL